MTLFHSILSAIFPENSSAYLHFLVHYSALPAFKYYSGNPTFPKLYTSSPSSAFPSPFCFFFCSSFLYRFLLMPLIHFSFYDHRVDSLRVLVRALAQFRGCFAALHLSSYPIAVAISRLCISCHKPSRLYTWTVRQFQWNCNEMKRRRWKWRWKWPQKMWKFHQ